MPRMFDILKKASNKKENNTKKDSLSFPRKIKDVFRLGDKQDITSSSSKTYIDALKRKDIDNRPLAKEKYNKALGVIEILFTKIKNRETIDLYCDEVYKTVDELTNQLILGDALLENVGFLDIKEDYLSTHTLNVCILSLAVGLYMKFNKSQLHTLGMACMLHDAGLLDMQDIIKEPRILTEGEFLRVKRHVSKAVELVPKTKDFFDGVREAIKAHHERIDGSGYPLCLKDNEINEFSKIIGLVDAYEAMTHNRPYKKAKMSHFAMRDIIGPGKSVFDPEVIKALVDKISIYPLGSFVKLNSGEIAKVISSNPNSPLRPLVLVVLDSYSKTVPEIATVDLSKSNSIYIKEPVYITK
ncbi:MAG: HD domain-containing phosphohydrolase [Candidatus Omnitrophota bacterium]